MPFIWAVRVATLPLTTRGEAGKDAARWPVAPLDSLSRKPLTHTMTGLYGMTEFAPSAEDSFVQYLYVIHPAAV